MGQEILNQDVDLYLRSWNNPTIRLGDWRSKCVGVLDPCNPISYHYRITEDYSKLELLCGLKTKIINRQLNKSWDEAWCMRMIEWFVYLHFVRNKKHLLHVVYLISVPDDYHEISTTEVLSVQHPQSVFSNNILGLKELLQKLGGKER